MNEYYRPSDHFALLPALMLALFGCAILLLEFLLAERPKQKRWLLGVAMVGLGFTGRALWMQHQRLAAGIDMIVAFDGALTIDGFALFFNWLFLITSAIVMLISYRYLEIENEHHGEYYGLILLAQCGMFFLAAGTDLITIFTGLELMSLSFYVLVGFLRHERRSNEAAMKYFLLGGFSSGFLLFGFSLLYGLSGSTNLAQIAGAISSRQSGDALTFLALAMTAIGLFFKISAAPFHSWAPDTYEGAPTAITAFLSVGSKTASFALLMRLFLDPFRSAEPVWQGLLIAAALASLTIGNLGAITQTNIKRLLAYSSISHAGYILLGLVSGNRTGLEGVAVYLLVYTFTNLGVFLVIVGMRRRGFLGENIEDLSGLMRTHPAYAVCMLIFLVSLAGLPPTAGFLGKYYIFLSLIETGHYVLAVIGTLYVAVSLYYYFRIVKSMFAGVSDTPAQISFSFGLRLALGITGVLTLGIGIYPEPFLRFAATSLLK